jgi:DNA-binding MarR family transcriptional regulator
MAEARGKGGIVEISAQAERIERDLSQIRQALRRGLEAAIASGGLTVPQMAVMRVIVRRDGISLKDLSREVSLAHSTVSGIVDRLEKRDLVERRADPADGRIARVHASTPVRKYVSDLLPKLTRGPLEAALQRATEKERAEIGRALRRLCALLEEQ